MSRLTFPRQPRICGAATHRSRRIACGATLLEVLVSILIFSFGILGLVGLQARASQFSSDAEDRNRAALLADEMAAQMRLHRTVSPMAQIAAWEARVEDTALSGLPNATASAAPVPGMANTALITITWRHPRQAAAIGNSQLVTQVVLTPEEVGSGP